MKRTLIAIAILALALPALATNGYFTHGTGTMSKAMAGAGLALPREAMDTATNPASAAFLERSTSASLAIFSPDRQYSIGGNPSGAQGTFGLTPGTVTSESKFFPMPALATNFRPSERTGLAFSLVAHGGMNTDYRTSTFYGADHTGVDLAQMYLSGTYARRFARDHAVGVSVIGVTQRFKASGLEAFGAMTHDAANLTGNGYDWSYGAGLQFGYLGFLRPNVSIAATYMPRVSMSKFDKYSGLFADDGSFDIPASFAAGIAYSATPDITMALDFQRIHYSDVRSVGHHLMPNLMTGALGLEEAAGFGWDDVSVIKLGLTWNATPDWAFSTGFSKANQPIPDSEVLFNILAPAVIEQHYTFGVTRALQSRPGRFTVALMYAPTQTVRGANPLEAPGAQEIELKMNEWELELGYSF